MKADVVFFFLGEKKFFLRPSPISFFNNVAMLILYDRTLSLRRRVIDLETFSLFAADRERTGHRERAAQARHALLPGRAEPVRGRRRPLPPTGRSARPLGGGVALSLGEDGGRVAKDGVRICSGGYREKPLEGSLAYPGRRPLLPLSCATAPCHQTICAVKSHPRALATSQI